MSVVVRKADLSKDALAIIDGARDFASRIRFGSMLPDKDAEFIEVVSRIVTLGNVDILVAESKEEIVGGIGIGYTPFMWNPRITLGEEIFWWTAQNAPFRCGWILFDEAMNAIEAKGAIPAFKSLETSPKGVGKLYAKRGMSPIETLHMALP